MALLEMRAAVYVRGASTLAGPLTLKLDEHARMAHACENDVAAYVTAFMAAGLVAPTRGSLFVGAFDPRIQPVQVKRITGFVPHAALPLDFSSFVKYVEYRAALWSLPRAESIVRARAILSKLDGVHEQFAFPLVGALLGAPRLLVLDRPQPAYAAQIALAAGSCAVFSTHANARDAERFTGGCLVPA